MLLTRSLGSYMSRARSYVWCCAGCCFGGRLALALSLVFCLALKGLARDEEVLMVVEAGSLVGLCLVVYRCVGVGVLQVLLLPVRMVLDRRP